MQMEENTQPFWRIDKVLTQLYLGHEESVHVQLTARINYVSKAALQAKAFKNKICDSLDINVVKRFYCPLIVRFTTRNTRIKMA